LNLKIEPKIEPKIENKVDPKVDPRDLKPPPAPSIRPEEQRDLKEREKVSKVVHQLIKQLETEEQPIIQMERPSNVKHKVDPYPVVKPKIQIEEEELPSKISKKFPSKPPPKASALITKAPPKPPTDDIDEPISTRPFSERILSPQPPPEDEDIMKKEPRSPQSRRKLPPPEVQEYVYQLATEGKIQFQSSLRYGSNESLNTDETSPKQQKYIIQNEEVDPIEEILPTEEIQPDPTPTSPEKIPTSQIIAEEKIPQRKNTPPIVIDIIPTDDTDPIFISTPKKPESANIKPGELHATSRNSAGRSPTVTDIFRSPLISNQTVDNNNDEKMKPKPVAELAEARGTLNMGFSKKTINFNCKRSKICFSWRSYIT